MMTLQDIFNASASHLLKQNAWSLAPADGDDSVSTTCQYRGVGGLKCAVGALITDECYAPHLEGGTVILEDVRQALVCSGVFPRFPSRDNEKVKLLVALQQTHDNYDPIQWPKQLSRVARAFNLDTDVLET